MAAYRLDNPSDDENIIQTEHRHLLRPPSPTFQPLPNPMIQTNETKLRRLLPHSRSASDFLTVKQSSFETTDDEIEETTTSSNRKHSLIVTCTQRSPSEIRVTLYPDTNDQQDIEVTEICKSDSLLTEIKSSKQNRVEDLRRALFDHRFSRRIHSSFSSVTTLRSSNRRRSTQVITQRSNRRHAYNLPRESKWHLVRSRLPEIAMTSESYARMKLIERDLRWIHLREQVRKQVLDMREISILRQQDDGLLKKSQKTSFDLKTIPINQVVHVEHDGRVYSIGTRDLVLGRLLGDEDVQLNTFAQLNARRKFQVNQSLLRQQEGRTRLKKHIAFSLCLCNLSFLVLMFAAMFIFAMKTIFELRARQFV